jgi:hypothetical protein
MAVLMLMAAVSLVLAPTTPGTGSASNSCDLPTYFKTNAEHTIGDDLALLPLQVFVFLQTMPVSLQPLLRIRHYAGAGFEASFQADIQRCSDKYNGLTPYWNIAPVRTRHYRLRLSCVSMAVYGAMQ